MQLELVFSVLVCRRVCFSTCLVLLVYYYHKCPLLHRQRFTGCLLVLSTAEEGQAKEKAFTVCSSCCGSLATMPREQQSPMPAHTHQRGVPRLHTLTGGLCSMPAHTHRGVSPTPAHTHSEDVPHACTLTRGCAPCLHTLTGRMSRAHTLNRGCAMHVGV